MSRKSELRKAAHEGKKKYPTQAAADAAIVKCKQPWAPGLESYKCPFGAHWHIGHNKRTKKNVMGAEQTAVVNHETNSEPHGSGGSNDAHNE